VEITKEIITLFQITSILFRGALCYTRESELKRREKLVKQKFNHLI